MLQRQIHTSLGCSKVVACIVQQCKSGADVIGCRALPVEQLGTLYLAAVYIVEGNGWTDKEVVGCGKQPARLHLRLPVLHLALVVVVVAHVVAHAPIVARKGVEVGGIVYALAVAGEDMRARHAKHIEAYCRHIAEERHVAGRLQGVVGVGTVQSGSHQA